MRSTSFAYKLKRAAVLIGALLIVFLVFKILVFGHPKGMAECGDPEATAPKIKAESALLYSVDLDKVIYSKEPDAIHDPYSITKLVTAYVAANTMDPNQTVTISQRAADDSVDGTSMFLKKGEKVTINELMYGALLVSGNDAAYALAEASGSVDGFIEEMNKTVQKWGCKDTHFTNSNGWQNKNHYTTANDLLIITRHVLEDETVSKIAFTRKYTMAATNLSGPRKMENHTTLINKKGSGVMGGKTGFWDVDDCTVTLKYNKDELSAILILLKDTGKGRVRDTKALLKYAHTATPGYLVADTGVNVGKVWVKHGKKTHVKTELSKAVHAYPKKQSAWRVRVKKHYDKPAAPLSKGDKVGTYEVYISGTKVATRDILISEDVPEGMFLSKIYISDRAGITIILVILALVLTIILLRIYNKKKALERRHYKH